MRLVAAAPEHIAALAKVMRPADVLECRACGREPAVALRQSLYSSLWALTALVDDEPHAMMGVSPRNMLEGVGVPWMLGSEKVYDHARDLLRYGPGIVAEMRGSFERLENMVHSENHRALRFLRHLGFTLSDAQEIIGGEPFVRFFDVRSTYPDHRSDRGDGGGSGDVRHHGLQHGQLQSPDRPAE